MASLFTSIRGLSKWRLFLLLVTAAAMLATITSALTYRFVLTESTASPVRIALIAPLSGPLSATGSAMQAGVRQALSQQRNTIAGHPVELVLIDESAPDAANRAVADPLIVGVVGPYSEAAAERVRPVLSAAGIASLSFASPAGAAAPGFFSIVPKADQEVRFLANYVRNVLGEPLVSVILPNRPEAAALADAFDEVLQRFGTRVVYRWSVADQAGLRAAIAEIADKQIAGSVLVLGDPLFSAQALASLRSAGVPNRVVGLRDLATQSFETAFKAAWTGSGTPGSGMNGTVATAPALFDTAGAAAQEFRTAIIARGGVAPDWISVLAHDATTHLASAIASLSAGGPIDGPTLRKRIPANLAGHNSAERALPGLAGPIFFDANAIAERGQPVGIYDGMELISAPTQLSPIREEGVSNYLEELAAGRALYVNDRFMYKTNVVYTGVRPEKVFDINPDANTVDIEFQVWFRWRGELDPQSIVFPNALTPIDMSKAEREGKSGDLSYRAYRVRGRFFMNYSNAAHAYGTQLVEVAFRHRTLGANNLLYVTDVLGMGLDKGSAQGESAEKPSGLLNRLFGTLPTGTLARQLASTRLLAGISGWLVDRAWLSQEVTIAAGTGDPTFVGFGKPAPLFSTIGLGVVLKPDVIDLQGAIPPNWMVYVAIFAAFGTVLAHMLDWKDRSHFWRVQTLLLRIVTWPLLLMSVSALALDNAQDTLSPSVVRTIDMTASALWWVIGAWLMNIVVERFVWVPLEARSERRIPTVFRMIVTLIIFILASFGIVAFVLGKTITSLLATSGILTLIVGLAVQSNLRDVFSGIMLNLERPFRIGDYLRVNRNIAQVVDISWRTTRLQVKDGRMIALPNGRLSDSEIENLSETTEYDADLTIAVDANLAPEAIIAAIREAVEGVAIKHELKRVGLKEVVRVGDEWVATYVASVLVGKYNDIAKMREAGMLGIWNNLRAIGVSWGPDKTTAGGARPIG